MNNVKNMNKLLIVDDDNAQRELFSLELSDEGYIVDEAVNGKKAIDMVKNNKYDLVIMDIRMPVMDGVESMQKIIEKNRKMPVIIHSAYSNYKSNFITWLADAYIIKSADLSELKRKINELIVKTENIK